MTLKNRRITLARRPVGLPKSEDFALVSETVREIEDGEILVRTAYLGISPSARIRMGTLDSYAPPLDIGETITSPSVGKVVRSRNTSFAEGEIVTFFGGWQEYCVSDGIDVDVVDPALGPLSSALGIFGSSGLTAWAGLNAIPRGIRAGETIVVSAASGAVGSLVCQVARLRGLEVVGIAGGPEKCGLVLDEGASACVDYRSSTFADDLRAACPEGVDVYFDNVGGAIRDTVFSLMNSRGRILICGLISEYNEAATPPGPSWLPILAKRLTIEGFLYPDGVQWRDRFLAEMDAWNRAGELSYREEIHDGLETAPNAFIAMLRGENRGKTTVRVAGDEV